MKYGAVYVGLLLAMTAGAAVVEGRHEEEEGHSSWSGIGGGDDSSFDYFMLTLQWPPSFCHSNKCSIPAGTSGFTIHGLWPNNNDGSYPSFCTKEKFNEDEVQDLLPKMDKIWPTLKKGGNDDTFWSHEYEKHGTCAEPTLSGEHEYFQAGLQLTEKFALLDGLAEAGIVPSASDSYSLEEMDRALMDAIGGKAIVQCSGKYLSGVAICLDKGLNPIDCDEDSSCRDSDIVMMPL